jgi:DNA-binding LacI/PurR family transcriptional regulator
MDKNRNYLSKARITAENVAEMVGVSRSTVSRAFDPNSRISAKVRRDILRIANEVGYRPTTAGRLAMKVNPNIVTLVVRDITNPIRASLTTRLIRELERDGLLPLIFQVPNANAASSRAEYILGNLPKVVVVSGFKPPASMITLCTQRGVPILVLNRGRVKGLATNQVSSDHFTGGKIVAQELVARGCRRIGFVSGHSVNDPDASEERIHGFLTALEDLGMSATAAFEGDHSYQSGANAAKEMFTLQFPPDGVFCGNDMMALGFLDAARDVFGKSAPDDFQLIGYDNIEMASWGAYQISTVAQDMDAVMATASYGIKTLISQPNRTINTLVPVKFLSRRTTSDLPKR